MNNESNVKIGSDKATINSNILTGLRALQMAERNFSNMEEQNVENFTKDDAELTLAELSQVHKAYKTLKLKAEAYITNEKINEL